MVQVRETTFRWGGQACFSFLRPSLPPPLFALQDQDVLHVSKSEAGGVELRSRMLAWGTDKTALPTPFGSTLDILNAAPHGTAVDLTLTALHPFLRLWSLARDGLFRSDRWYTGPIFALDRVDVAHKIASMRKSAETSIEAFSRPMPLLGETLRILTTPAGAAASSGGAKANSSSSSSASSQAAAAASAAADATLDDADLADSSGSGGGTAALASMATTFGLPKSIVRVPNAARTVARAMDARLASFEKRQFPLIKVLCNPHLQVRIQPAPPGKDSARTSR